MKYNLLYYFGLVGQKVILALTEEELSDFIKNYEFGESTYFIDGISHPIKNIHHIEIFDSSKYQKETNKKNIKDDIEYFITNILKRSNHIDSYRLAFENYGEDITNKKIKIAWGGKSEPKAKIIETLKVYINKDRLHELNAIKSTNFDLSKLIRLCEEINSSYQNNNFFAVGALVRALLDHIPPVFGGNNFDEIANNYKPKGDSKSFKESMTHLNNSMRKITDSFLHSHIRKSETLPNDTTIDCKRDLDKLLGEIIRVLKL